MNEERLDNLKLALPNFFGQDADRLAQFAHKFGFAGVEWSLDLNPDERDFLRKMNMLKGLEVRYHCFWPGIDIAHADQRAEQALHIFKQAVGLVSKVNGGFMTVHIGLGQNAGDKLNWEKAIHNLGSLVLFGAERGVAVCLENITTAWTSKPRMFRTLIEKTGAGVTLDIGHVHVCRKNMPIDDFFKLYLLPNRERIFNAHIYHTETDQGHVAPVSIDQISGRLRLLMSATRCDWWVIELSKPDEILKTRSLLSRFLNLRKKIEDHPIR